MASPGTTSKPASVAATPLNINGLIRNVEKLTGIENFAPWKWQMQMIFRGMNIWHIVSGKEEKPSAAGESLKDWEVHADNALTVIGLSVSSTQVEYIIDSTNGVEAWKALMDVYEANSRASRIVLKRDFYGYQYKEGQSITVYCRDINSLATSLKAISVPLTHTDITDVMIFNLPSHFGAIATFLSLRDDSLTPKEVESALIEEEKHMIASNTFSLAAPVDNALFSKKGKQPANSSNGHASSSRGNSSGRSCWYCGDSDHAIYDCPLTPANSKKKTEEHAMHADEDNYSDHSFSARESPYGYTLERAL